MKSDRSKAVSVLWGRSKDKDLGGQMGKLERTGLLR